MGQAAGKIAHKDTAVVELLLNADQYNRTLRNTYQAKEMQDAKDSQKTMQRMASTDKMMKNSFKTLENALEKIDEKHQKIKKNVTDVPKITTPQIPKEDMYVPEIADEYEAELQAMYQVANRFATKISDMGMDPSSVGLTIEEKLGEGSPIGGKEWERQGSIGALKEMEGEEKETQKIARQGIEIRARRIKQLEKERQKLLDQSAEIRKSLDLTKKLSAKDEERLKLANSLSGQAGHKTALINDEIGAQKVLNKEIKQSELRLEEINRTKEKAIGIDNKLKAVKKRTRDEEKSAYKEFRKQQQENINLAQKEINLAKERNRATQKYTEQVDAMVQSVGQTLAGAIGLSIAAFTALQMKMQSVVSLFQDFENELINAQSIFQTNQDTLFGLSDEIVNFGQTYGIEMQNASTGLYQLASAGLSAEESMEVLNNTLKLSMAVQGDHNTISKLTTQTIFGFGLEMSDSAALTDKFAHAINKSLIEYQDLASAVKFAMPFFVSTGQSVDQLLGSLQVLTNRALEAGIAGRGLRQALAEFAQHADDNTAAFAKMGVQITNSNGEFKQLTEIAKDFQMAMGPAASDVELMTTLLEDLNVRGATAFVHLVQNADEFQGAVDDLQNSAGSATEMAEIQQASLQNQIQRVKNALQAPFLLSDEVGKANGVMNEFALTLHMITQDLEGMFTIVEDGVIVGLTPLGESLKQMVIVTMKQLHSVIIVIVEALHHMSEEGTDFVGLINMLAAPLRMVIRLISMFGSEAIEAALIMKMMNGLIPINNMLISHMIKINAQKVQQMQVDLDQHKLKIVLQRRVISGDLHAVDMHRMLDKAKKGSMEINETAISQMKKQMMVQAAVNVIQFANIMLMRKYAQDSPMVAAGIGVVTGSLVGLAMALQLVGTGGSPWAFAGVVAGMAATTAIMNAAMTQLLKTPEIDYEAEFSPIDAGYAMADTGLYPMAETGLSGLGNRHRAVMVEPGEAIISKSQNMLNGNNQGITLNIQGDVYDGDNFAEKISEVLPNALRKSADYGGM